MWRVCNTESSNTPKYHDGNRKATGKEGKRNVFLDKRSWGDQEGVTPHIIEQDSLQILSNSSFPPNSNPSGKFHYSDHLWVPVSPHPRSLLPSHYLSPLSSGHSLSSSWSPSNFLFLLPSLFVLPPLSFPPPLPLFLYPPHTNTFPTVGRWGTKSTCGRISFFIFNQKSLALLNLFNS